MTARRNSGPLYHAAALCKWVGRTAGDHPRAVQWLVTGFLSMLLGGGAALGVSKTDAAAPERATMDRRWLVDSFPVYLRPTIRKVVQEENASVSAKLDSMEEKNREVRRFIVSTDQYRRWKVLRERRRQEEERINNEAERGFSQASYDAPAASPAEEGDPHPGRQRE